VIIRNMQEAEAALRPYVPLVAQLTGKDTTLDRVWPLMELLGNPQDCLKVIHVAGTSGKSSTAYYTAALLEAAGQKAGLTVSPHVDSVAERVQINGRPLPEADFCRLLGEFLEIIQQAGQKPSYFELLYAFALWVFDRQKVDYAVVETGMGGLHDATNVARRADKVCIVTDIGLDHTHILGNNLEEITRQKVGIVHEGNHIFMYGQAEEIMKVVRHRAHEKHAPLHLLPEAAEPKIGYQRRNWLLANYTYQYLAKRDKLPLLSAEKLRQTQTITIPARLETRRLGVKILIMDGAHNAQKMQAFVDSLRQLYPRAKPAILLALKDGKDYESVVPLLAPLAEQVIVTTFDTSQDLPARSMDPEMLAKAFADAGVATQSITDQRQAFQALLKSPAEVLIVTGSFYLLSQIRNNEKLNESFNYRH